MIIQLRTDLTPNSTGNAYVQSETTLDMFFYDNPRFEFLAPIITQTLEETGVWQLSGSVSLHKVWADTDLVEEAA